MAKWQVARWVKQIWQVASHRQKYLGTKIIYVFSGRPPWVDVHLANRLKIPHTFVIHTYTKPTKCHFCNKVELIKLILRMGAI